MNTTVRSNGRLITRKPFKVLVCLVTLVAFLFNTISYDLVWAVGKPSGFPDGGSGRAGGSGLLKELRVDTFKLPEYLGRVKDSWSPKLAYSVERIAYSKSKEGRLYDNLSAKRYPRLTDGAASVGQALNANQASDSQIVIHIQDAHCNYACQHQIAKIIEFINQEYGVDTINLEGGAKDYDLSIFTDIKDKILRDKASDYFVREGLVNGAEYFAVNNPEKVTLWGIEDRKLYIDNLKVYRNSLVHKEEVDKDLRSLSLALSSLKIKIYSKELLDFDMKYGAYKAGNIEFKEYLTYLIDCSRRLNVGYNVDNFKDKIIDSKIYPNIYLLNQVLGGEGWIDFKKANSQREELIGSLQKKLSKNALEELVVKTVEFKQERISQKDFYDYLSAKAKQFGADTSAFTELKKYAAYISVYDSIDKAKVIEEMGALEDAIKASLIRNDKERELSLLSKNFALLKNMFNISLTKDDYRYYLANKDSFNTSRYVDFIKGKIGTVPFFHLTSQTSTATVTRSLNSTTIP